MPAARPKALKGGMEMVRIISLVVSVSALLCSPAFAGDQSKLPEGVWDQTRWDQCRWAADSTKPKQAKQTRKCKNKAHPSYQLRHTFASLCLQSGVAPGWLANVLGHSTLQTTFKHYARFIKDTSRENEARM